MKPEPGPTDQVCIRKLICRVIATAGGMVELRVKKNDGVHREFHHDPVVAARRAGELAERGDVYAGALARKERRGGRDALLPGRLVWADCDSPESVGALMEFRPVPSFLLESGSVTDGVPHLHGWWLLSRRCEPRVVEVLNRRLAHKLASDARVYDAARVLRLPGTLNHKHAPPVPVLCADAGDQVPIEEFVAAVPLVKVPMVRQPPRVIDQSDSLFMVPADAYIWRLTGREVTRNGKIRCPFHAGGEERTPSLQPYEINGWFCFGCEQGGTVIDFAALLWGMDPHRDYRAIRARLTDELGLGGGS